jgi:N-methylhydantoinase A/oxoprolinase/acetone carboxylase beta subunit
MLDAVYEAFCALHDRIYGHSTRSPARFVNLRAVQRAANRIGAATRPAPTEPASPKGRRSVLLESGAEAIDVAVFERDGLALGQVVPGPAIVEQSDTTTLIDAGWQAEVLGDQVLHLTRACK